MIMEIYTKMNRLSCMLVLLCCSQVGWAQVCRNSLPESTPDNRFIIHGDEVIDTKNALVWQRCSLGQSGADCSGGSASTHNWSEALQAAGNGWRLPNLKELASIVERKCMLPAINSRIFPNTVPDIYWTSSYAADLLTKAWFVDFHSGAWSSEGKAKLYHVRLVRDAP